MRKEDSSDLEHILNKEMNANVLSQLSAVCCGA